MTTEQRDERTSSAIRTVRRAADRYVPGEHDELPESFWDTEFARAALEQLDVSRDEIEEGDLT